jgi:hypothetical protein
MKKHSNNSKSFVKNADSHTQNIFRNEVIASQNKTIKTSEMDEYTRLAEEALKNYNSVVDQQQTSQKTGKGSTEQDGFGLYIASKIKQKSQTQLKTEESYQEEHPRTTSSKKTTPTKRGIH